MYCEIQELEACEVCYVSTTPTRLIVKSNDSMLVHMGHVVNNMLCVDMGRIQDPFK